MESAGSVASTANENIWPEPGKGTFVADCAAYHNGARTCLTLDKDAPLHRPAQAVGRIALRDAHKASYRVGRPSHVNLHAKERRFRQYSCDFAAKG